MGAQCLQREHEGLGSKVSGGRAGCRQAATSRAGSGVGVFVLEHELCPPLVLRCSQ